MNSIEWLIEEMLSKGYFKESVTLTNIDHLQYKAEEMHKQEILTAVNIDKRQYDNAEQYYQKTFVSKGSDAASFQKDENGKPLTYWGGVDFTNPNANNIKSGSTTSKKVIRIDDVNEMADEDMRQNAQLPQQETYGSKGSEFQQVDQNNPVTRGSTALVRVSKPTSSQTEISDEEIEMLAWKNPCLSRQDVYELFDEVFKNKTVQGIFKISVSKEVRQFKERLRQLAKEKYREQLKNK